MTRIQLISTDHPLYEQEVDLRNRVLLEPIGISVGWLEEKWPDIERRLEHYVAVIDHPKGQRVVGCVCLLPDHPERGVAQLMQMAVDPQRQREGIGRSLAAELERRAFGELGVRSLFCHAREGVEPFYERIGWKTEGSYFEEAGVPHVKMVYSGGNVGRGAA